MKVTLVDYNTRGVETMVDALSVCRNKKCSVNTIHHCLTAKPIPHMSVLEFCWFCFKFEEISRVLSHQLVRHRHFSFMQRSQRHVDESNCDFVLPGSGVSWFREALETSRQLYQTAIERGYAEEDARYLLPNATATQIFVAGNGRVWWEWLNKRLCRKYVQHEHYLLATKVLFELRKALPDVPWDCVMPCKECGLCE